MQEKGKGHKDDRSMQKVEAQTDEEIDLEGIPPEIEEVLRTVPKESRREIHSLMVSSAMIRSPEADIAKKITPDHITQMLDNQKQSMEYSFKDNKQIRWICFAVLVITLIFLSFLVVFMRDNPELLEKIITALISGGLGAFGGYGIGKNKRD